MRIIVYMQVVNEALYSSKLANDYRFEMERTERMRIIVYMQVVNEALYSSQLGTVQY
jgi:hypothetical protein